MTYDEVAKIVKVPRTTVDNDLRHIRGFISDFAAEGFKIREISYYACYRSKMTDENKHGVRSEAMKALLEAIRQDYKENFPYKNLTFF